MATFKQIVMTQIECIKIPYALIWCVRISKYQKVLLVFSGVHFVSTYFSIKANSEMENRHSQHIPITSKEMEIQQRTLLLQA